MSTFQLTLLGVFIFALIVGVLVFAGVLPGFRAPTGGTGGTVTLWGTVPESVMNTALEPFRSAHKSDFTLVYVAKDTDRFDAVLVDAIASGQGPDLVLMPSELAAKEANKILTIPFSSYPESSFNRDFIQQGRLYLTKDGSLALPALIDPLVMYVNRDLLSSARLASIPATWGDIQTAVKSLTLADGQSNITQSTIALGQFSNILHAKDLLSLLILQAGNPIVTNSGGISHAVLTDSVNYGPADSALTFFTRFADPTNSLYSWNSGQPEARDAFTRGILAFYLGYASENDGIAQQNPQLNYDIALVPQIAGKNQLTVGRLYGLSILKSSKNIQTAFKVATLLTSDNGDASLAAAYGLAPARTDLLKTVPNDSAKTVFNQAAVMSRGWPDPDPVATAGIFQNLVESVQVRGAKIGEALALANKEIDLLLKP